MRKPGGARACPAEPLGESLLPAPSPRFAPDELSGNRFTRRILFRILRAFEQYPLDPPFLRSTSRTRDRSVFAVDRADLQIRSHAGSGIHGTRTWSARHVSAQGCSRVKPPGSNGPPQSIGFYSHLTLSASVFPCGETIFLSIRSSVVSAQAIQLGSIPRAFVPQREASACARREVPSPSFGLSGTRIGECSLPF